MNLRAEREPAVRSTGPLTVALVTKTFPPFSYGGTESYAYELACELSRCDSLRVHVLCLQPVEEPVPEEVVEAFRENQPFSLSLGA